MTDPIEILPCPFCGGKAEARSGPTFCSVQCRECGGNYEAQKPYSCLDKIIECWNHRPQGEAALREELAAVKKDRDNLLGKSTGKCVHEVDIFSSRGCYNCVLNQAEVAESRAAGLTAALGDVANLGNCCVGADGKWQGRGHRTGADHHPDCRITLVLKDASPLLAKIRAQAKAEAFEAFARNQRQYGGADMPAEDIMSEMDRVAVALRKEIGE